MLKKCFSFSRFFYPLDDSFPSYDEFFYDDYDIDVQIHYGIDGKFSACIQYY